MKFTIARDDLLNALNAVSKGMSSRSTLPILSGILIDATTKGSVVFQTTDLEISIKHTTQANITEEGRAVVPGKLFSDIIKNLPDAAIQIACQQEKTNIFCLNISYSVSSLNPADFPYFPDFSPSTTITADAKQLASKVKRVGKAVSRDESRVILTGIYMSVEQGKAVFAATDSYRLAVDEIEIEEDIEDFEVVIPGKTLEDISRIAASQEQIKIGFSDNQIIFEFGETVFVSRKIEGTYPNYKQLIPSSNPITVTLDTPSLVSAIKRVSLLAQTHTPIRLAFSEEDQNVVVSAKTQDIGGAQESLDAAVEGGDIEIAFNHQYILDGLSTIEGDVILELQTSLKPGILKSSVNKNFLYLVMPVRLS